jgi:hypothetical protein
MLTLLGSESDSRAPCGFEHKKSILELQIKMALTARSVLVNNKTKENRGIARSLQIHFQTIQMMKVIVVF